MKNKKENWIKVGRWMSEEEYEKMKNTHRVQIGSGGLTFVTTGGADSFTASKIGTVYIEFEVEEQNLIQGGKSNWFKLVGIGCNNTTKAILEQQNGVIEPKIKNISVNLHKK